jgi:hypothetical protein
MNDPGVRHGVDRRCDVFTATLAADHKVMKWVRWSVKHGNHHSEEKVNIIYEFSDNIKLIFSMIYGSFTQYLMQFLY